MLSLIPALLNALIAIPKIADSVNAVVTQITLWYVQRQQAAVLSSIADAAAFAAKAQTDDDRYKAAQMWQDALTKPRTTTI